MPLPSSIQGITLKVTSVTQDNPPIQAIHEQIISSAVAGENIGIPITASDILNAFSTKPAGTIFTPSIVVNYVNNITSVSVPASTPNVSNFVPKKITSILSLANTLNKLTTDSSFSLSDFITTNRLGDLSYSSSDTNVAEVDSSGYVTLKGVVGTTTINVSLAASANGVYTAASAVSSQLVVSVPPPPPSSPISLAANGVTIRHTTGLVSDVPSFPWFIQANLRGTGTEWFGVVDNTAKSYITNYAKNETIGINYFKPPNQISPIPFNNIVTTHMTDMFNLFLNTTTFNQDISSWDTSKVTNMIGLLRNNHSFNKPLNNWNTSSVIYMDRMFEQSGYNQPIGSWDTSSVIGMNNMFNGAYAFNQNISNWNVSLVTPKPPTGFRVNGSVLLTINIPLAFR
jgi:surface protein